MIRFIFLNFVSVLFVRLIIKVLSVRTILRYIYRDKGNIFKKYSFESIPLNLSDSFTRILTNTTEIQYKINFFDKSVNAFKYKLSEFNIQTINSQRGTVNLHIIIPYLLTIILYRTSIKNNPQSVK